MSRPSHSTVVAYIALFVALGGTAFALATNSVKSRHIKDGQVKSVDVRDDAITGGDVDELSLENVVRRSEFQGSSFRDEMRYYAYNFDTEVGVVTSRNFGELSVQTTGTPGEFKLCLDSNSVVIPWVIYVNGARTAGAFPVSAVEQCTPANDADPGNDFTIFSRSTLIFGVHGGSTGPGAAGFQLYGFGRS